MTKQSKDFRDKIALTVLPALISTAFCGVEGDGVGNLPDEEDMDEIAKCAYLFAKWVMIARNNLEDLELDGDDSG